MDVQGQRTGHCEHKIVVCTHATKTEFTAVPVSVLLPPASLFLAQVILLVPSLYDVVDGNQVIPWPLAGGR
jgi:hypothetical protein